MQIDIVNWSKILINRPTVVNELCALLMGGDEIKDVLEQMANLGETE